MEWQDTFAVGVPQFDEHHRHLFNLLNKAHHICLTKMQPDVFNDIVNELVEYVSYHFAAEERFLKETAYADFDMHREEHQKFSSKIEELCRLLSTGSCPGIVESVELTDFLMNWLYHHILEVDMDYGKLYSGGSTSA